MNKEDLRELIEAGSIITLRNGDRLVKTYSDEIKDLDEDIHNTVCSIDEFDEDLKCSYDSDYDIVKIEKPSEYKTVYIRAEDHEEDHEDKVATNYIKLLVLLKGIKLDLEKTLICNRHFSAFDDEVVNVDVDHINYLISMIEDAID